MPTPYLPILTFNDLVTYNEVTYPLVSLPTNAAGYLPKTFVNTYQRHAFPIHIPTIQMPTIQMPINTIL